MAVSSHVSSALLSKANFSVSVETPTSFQFRCAHLRLRRNAGCVSTEAECLMSNNFIHKTNSSSLYEVNKLSY